jgi:hypothetical protein
MCYPNASMTGDARTMIAPLDLQLAIVHILREKLAGAKPFSAWQIAKEVQAANPTLAIAHAEAKRSVHHLMTQEAEFGRVTVEYADWRIYTPVPAETPDTVLVMDPALVGVFRQDDETLVDDTIGLDPATIQATA